MSDLKVNQIQLGQSGTASQNFTLTTGVDGTMTLARGNAGATTDDLFTIDADGNVLFPSDTNLLGKSFVSAEQTITSAGSLTIPHGLGAMPSLIQCRLVCISDEDNYVAGDELIISPDFLGITNAGLSIVPDATNLNIRYGSATQPFQQLNKTTGASGSFNKALWKLVVRAWK